jgi:hypothetical protein
LLEFVVIPRDAEQLQRLTGPGQGHSEIRGYLGIADAHGWGMSA